jgi:glycerol 2-dehydrogenase (NADP+)
MNLYTTLDADSPSGQALAPDQSPTFVETYLEMEKLLSTGSWPDCNPPHFCSSSNLGKVRSLGVSNFSIKNLDILLPKIKIIPVVNQVELHPCFPQERLLGYCTDKGILLGNGRQFYPRSDGS